MFESLLTFNGLVSLTTLTLMEIVLGIDNLIFISVLSDKLPMALQNRARVIGLALALIMRILLLWSVTWIIGFSEPIVDNLFGTNHDISIRDLILLAGGLFLIYKSTMEIHENIEGDHQQVSSGKKTISLQSAIVQIVLLDIVFSFDSILTAIGLVNDPHKDLIIMVIAVVISLIVMLLFAKPISDFVNNHPTIKMLALSFLLLIGVLLVAESWHQNIPKGYIYFAISFSLFVEMLNMWMKKRNLKNEKN